VNLAEITVDAGTVKAVGDLIIRLWETFGLWLMGIIFALIIGWIIRGRGK